ncbi:hypothetical protein V8F20_008398 [Naviculisporaceae sp. PSN 640]
MCFHHRLVFACGHYTWLSTIARPCPVETAFTKGQSNIGCSKMWSSGFCTLKINEKKCETCGEKEAKTARQAAEIRKRIGELRGLVEKITSASSSSSSSLGKISSSGSSRSSSSASSLRMTKEQLIEAGVVFDDEYEAQLEEFSPISSPTGSSFFSEP